jgi:hypothetical protein
MSRRDLIFWLILAALIAAFIVNNKIFDAGTHRGGPTKRLLYSLAKDFVNERLLIPSSAKYQDIDSVQFLFAVDSSLLVIGYVEANNGVGNTARSRINVQGLYDHETGRWKIQGMSLSDPSIFIIRN